MTMGENDVFSDETDSEEEQSPILIAKNAGANLRSPAGAAINRKRKLYVNEGKYKLRGSQKSVKMSRMGSYQGISKPTLL